MIPTTWILLVSALAAPVESRVDIDFRGGTLTEYIEAVESAVAAAEDSSHPPLSVVVGNPDVADRVRMPPAKLKRVVAMTAMQLIQEVATGPGVEYVKVRQLATGVFVVKAHVAENADDDLDETASLPSTGRVGRVARGPTSRATGVPASRRRGGARVTGGVSGSSPRTASTRSSRRRDAKDTQVFSIREIVGRPGDVEDRGKWKEEVATVLTAIESVLELARDADVDMASVVRFHEESGILLVQGTQRELTLIHSVLTRMKEDRQNERAREMFGGAAGAGEDFFRVMRRMKQDSGEEMSPASKEVEYAMSVLQHENEKLRRALEKAQQQIEELQSSMRRSEQNRGKRRPRS